MENNKIIAEFMGIESYKSTKYTMFVYEENNHRTDVDLHYHTSWDWLMPVLKKINLKLNPQNYSRWVRINKPTEYLIGEVHQAVVDFIKNQNK